MIISTAIVTYRRSWALKYSLNSLSIQTRQPDEVIIILKPSGDGSEEVVNEFRGKLPINLIVQESGGFVDAVDMAIRNSRSDVILFLDDDAVAEERWVEKYEHLFRDLKNAGGISGLTYRAYLRGAELVKTSEPFYQNEPTAEIFYRKPLEEYRDYCGWISISGFMGLKRCTGVVVKSTSLDGVNMGLRIDAVRGCPLSQLYRRSKKGIWNEKILAYCAKKRGYDTYIVSEVSTAPVAWHIVHENSLTRGRGFWHEFWLHYDRVANFWRLKRLGARVSYVAYLIALLVALRRRTLPRILATIYGLSVRI